MAATQPAAQPSAAVPWPAQQWSPGTGARPALPSSALPGPVAERLRRLAEEAGPEPLCAYVHDPAAAGRRAALLRARLPDWAEVFYAVKANSFPAVLEALAPGTDGFDVSSEGEAAAARAASARALIATGPGKTDAMLTALARTGVDFVSAESTLELHRIAAAADRAGRRIPVVLRVNAATGPLQGALRMDGHATQFGIGEDALPEAAAVARALPGLDLVGYHFHVVSNNLDADAHAAHVQARLRWAVRAAREHGFALRVLDAGGGLGVAPRGGAPFDLGRFAARLRAAPPPPGVRVVLEPGRWLVADSGYYAAQVTDVKEVAGSRFAVLAGGINHFMLPALLEVALDAAVVDVDRWPYACPRPVLTDTTVALAGPLCTPEDILARGIRVGRLRAGDLVVFPLAGAYGWEFALRGFLGRRPPVHTVVRATPQRVSARSGTGPVAAAGTGPSPVEDSSR
ncbi:alanine racemase [Streptomyces aureoversilis]|uniref:Alanine racemase n=1 Tax=Streptomyces aureoversilis TaxID=67277 RepID=A0ABW0A6P8_9ACTN